MDAMISEWIELVPRDPQTVDDSIFTPLNNVIGVMTTSFGSVVEDPSRYMLVIVWNSRNEHQSFTVSPEGEAFLRKLQDLSGSALEVKQIDFDNEVFWPSLGPSTELRTVPFPADLSEQLRDQVLSLSGLTLPYGLGFGRAGPYRKLPVCGWIDGTREYEGRQSVACLWVNSWNSAQEEKDFKEQQREVPEDFQEQGRLILESWETKLQELGALGWVEKHVNFQWP